MPPVAMCCTTSYLPRRTIFFCPGVGGESEAISSSFPDARAAGRGEAGPARGAAGLYHAIGASRAEGQFGGPVHPSRRGRRQNLTFIERAEGGGRRAEGGGKQKQGTALSPLSFLRPPSS